MDMATSLRMESESVLKMLTTGTQAPKKNQLSSRTVYPKEVKSMVKMKRAYIRSPSSSIECASLPVASKGNFDFCK